MKGAAEDHFEALGFEPRADLAAGELRARYNELCGTAHPDAGGDRAAFQRLQRALAELSSPGRRLRHWLDLAGARGPEGGELDAEVAGLFAEIGALLQRCEAVKRRRAEAQSALARSLAEREAIQLLGELEAARARTEAAIERLTGQFGEFDREGAAACGERAARTARSLLFLEKWERQLREAWARLAD